MILVDTSVWVSHLRQADAVLTDLLEDGAVLTHALVIGELACGRIPQRAELLRMMRALPHAPEATHEEALILIERNRLMGRGIGYIDAQLLAAAALAEGARLWTEDARLASAAARLFLSYDRSR